MIQMTGTPLDDPHVEWSDSDGDGLVHCSYGIYRCNSM